MRSLVTRKKGENVTHAKMSLPVPPLPVYIKITSFGRKEGHEHFLTGGKFHPVQSSYSLTHIFQIGYLLK